MDLSEMTETEVRAWLPGGGMAWDIGSNTGMTLPLLLVLFDQVLAFEPAVESFSLMEASWGQNDRVQLVNKAVADHDGVMMLAVRPATIYSGQLVAPGLWWPWGEETPREVPCITLDTLAETHGVPDFVKIDTEGGELKVLQGAAALLAQRETSWWTEFHDIDQRDACERLFLNAGYDVEISRPSNRYEEGSKEWLSYGWMKVVPHKGGEWR
jgi:FkbM family methyltransferase